MHSTAVSSRAGGCPLHTPRESPPRTSRRIAAALLLGLLLAPGAGRGAERTGGGVPAQTYDLLLARPIGLASVVVGAGFFAIAWPLTVLFGDPGAARATFLEEPYRFTFRRPLGDFYDY